MSVTDTVMGHRYRLESRLAAGAVGEVWRAVDLVLDRRVAVKLLRQEYADHPEALARFRAEARHAGSLSHPGIAQLYDYGDADPPHPPFLVMELVDGPSLAGVLATGPLDPARTMKVVAQTAAALEAAHRTGLVHRDIKPANLLLGPGGTVKVTDFGIAHAAGSVPLTRTGTLVGTPAYLAPERAAGGPALPASDLYSLGVVAYECLAGAPPFSGPPLEVAAAHQYRPLPPLPAGVPGEVAALVEELTAKNPADRPATAGQVVRRAGMLGDALAAGATAAAGAIASDKGAATDNGTGTDGATGTDKGAATDNGTGTDGATATDKGTAADKGTMRLPSVSAGVPPAGAGVPPMTLATALLPDAGRQLGWEGAAGVRRQELRWEGIAGWSRRRLVLAVAALLAAGLAWWGLTGLNQPARPHPARPAPPAAPTFSDTAPAPVPGHGHGHGPGHGPGPGHGHGHGDGNGHGD